MDVGSLRDHIKKLSSKVLKKRVHERVFQTVHVMTEKRIFKKGLDANNRQIGVYSEGYLKTRKRKNYPGGKRVILQAENQMVNDYRFGIDSKGNYVSGFANSINFLKSFWVEGTYDTSIFELTQDEEKQMEILLDKELKKYLNG